MKKNCSTTEKIKLCFKNLQLAYETSFGLITPVMTLSGYCRNSCYLAHIIYANGCEMAEYRSR